MGRHKFFRTYPDLATFFDKSGVTQIEFAAQIGKTQSYVSRVKSGELEPTLTDALVISKVAGVPLESLRKPKSEDTLLEA